MCSYVEFGPVVQKEMSFKDIYFYLELWQLLCSADPNYLCYIRRYHEQFCEIIFSLHQ